MKKDIYKAAKLKKIDPLIRLGGQIQDIKKRLDDIDAKKEVNIITHPDIQKVEVLNRPEEKKIEFPVIQNVHVTNPPPDVIVEKVELPKVFPVTVLNLPPPPQPADLKNVEKLLKRLIEKEYPETKLPFYSGNNPKTADPTDYINVRLTNGKRYYDAMSEAFVSAGHKNFPFVNATTGLPQPAAVDNAGNIQSNIVIDNINLTVSGTQVVTSVSGTLHAFIDNFPNFPSIFGVRNLDGNNNLIGISGAPIIVDSNSSTSFGAGVPGTAFFMGARNTLGDLNGLYLDQGNDTQSASKTLQVDAMLYNNSQWERPRTISAAANTTGKGVPAAAIVVFDGAKYQNITGANPLTVSGTVSALLYDANSKQMGIPGNPVFVTQSGVVNVGRNLLSVQGVVTASGVNQLLPADANFKIKVFAFSITTLSTTPLIWQFQDGSANNLWGGVAQAPTNVNIGANLSVTPPAWLFDTPLNSALNLALGFGFPVYYSIAYFKEAT